MTHLSIKRLAANGGYCVCIQGYMRQVCTSRHSRSIDTYTSDDDSSKGAGVSRPLPRRVLREKAGQISSPVLRTPALTASIPRGQVGKALSKQEDNVRML